MVTEYLAGGSLYELIKSKHPILKSVSFKLKVAKCIAKALVYLHSNSPPVIHRDLTPSNILLTHDFAMAKVSDFGLSRVLNREGNMTSAIGTCTYMAPEVFKGSSYDEKADVFSFALILWTMWTLREPEEGKHPQMWATLVASEGLRPPLDESIPNDWLCLITQCWQQKPEDRLSFLQVLSILEEIENKSGT